MSGRLSGKVAIVTGAGQGIGRATARRFAEEGARVIVAEINAQTGADSARDANKYAAHDGCAEYQPLDAGDEASWRQLFTVTLQRFGSVQIVVNNAALRTPLTLEQTGVKDWEANQRVTAAGVFLGTKLAGEYVTGRGAIVNVASIAAFVGLPESLPYSAAKGAVRALSRSAALHFARQGRDIRVNVVAPGSTLTESIDKQLRQIAQREATTPEAVMARLTANVPVKRWAEPRELANAILFLASDEASYITGAELLVDGGLTAA